MLNQSLVSDTGCVEFAKRFLVDRMQVDLSPVSVKSCLIYYYPTGLMAIHDRYGVKRFETLCRIGGSGFRTLSSLNNPSSTVVKRRKAMWEKAKYPMHIWLGRGKPLNPYLHGFLVSWLRKELRPKDLKVAPDNYFQQIGMKEFLEWSLLRSWMSSWLKLVHWYSSKALAPDVTVEILLTDAPVVSLSWNADRKDEN